MNELGPYQDLFEVLSLGLVLIIALSLFVWMVQPPPVVVPEGSYITPDGVVAPIPAGFALVNDTLIRLPTPTPTPTPTPAPTMSEAQMMATTNGLHMGEWLSWKRENVSGYKDMSTHVTVYGWKMFGTVNWRSISWGSYFRGG
jgi:hypothetical protein